MQGVRFKKGETVPHPTICSRITCHQPPNGFSGVGYVIVKQLHKKNKLKKKLCRCGVFVPRPGCRVSDMDNNKRYPDCCPKEICD